MPSANVLSGVVLHVFATNFNTFFGATNHSCCLLVLWVFSTFFTPSAIGSPFVTFIVLAWHSLGAGMIWVGIYEVPFLWPDPLRCMLKMWALEWMALPPHSRR